MKKIKPAGKLPPEIVEQALRQHSEEQAERRLKERSSSLFDHLRSVLVPVVAVATRRGGFLVYVTKASKNIPAEWYRKKVTTVISGVVKPAREKKR